MEDSIEKELVSNDSDEDIDFTSRKRHGKQALRIEESDSGQENDVPPASPVEANGTVGGSNSEDNSNESKESSEDCDKISLSTQRKKKKRKKKSDEKEVNYEVILLSWDSRFMIGYQNVFHLTFSINQR